MLELLALESDHFYDPKKCAESFTHEGIQFFLRISNQGEVQAISCTKNIKMLHWLRISGVKDSLLFEQTL
jgi:hypothetical protein